MAFILYFVFNSTYSQKFDGGVPYGPYILGGTLVVSYLANGAVAATQNLQSSAGIFTKLPASPKLFALSNAIVLTINFSFGLVPLFVWNIIKGGKFSLMLFLLPIFLASTIMFITGLSLMTFSYAVRFGDVISIMSLLATLAMFVSPVFYPLNSVSQRALFLLNLNPLTHYLSIFRKIVLDYGQISELNIIVCFSTSFLLIVIGVLHFNKNWKRTVSLL